MSQIKLLNVNYRSSRSFSYDLTEQSLDEDISKLLKIIFSYIKVQFCSKKNAETLELIYKSFEAARYLLL